MYNHKLITQKMTMDRPVLKYAFWTLRIVPDIQVCTIRYTLWNTVDMALEM